MRANLICTDFFRWGTQGIRENILFIWAHRYQEWKHDRLKVKRKAGVLDSMFASEAISLQQVRPRY